MDKHFWENFIYFFSDNLSPLSVCEIEGPLYHYFYYCSHTHTHQPLIETNMQVDLGMRRLLERVNAAVLLAATARERRLRGDSALVDVNDVPVEPSEPVITPAG